jgi:hypothetical protein
VLGTSLEHGQGYRLLNEPGNIQAIQYPPGLPAIVALHEIVLGTSDPVSVGIWLRRSWCALSILYISFVFLLCRRFFSRGYAVLAALVCLLNYEMIFLSSMCFAELPFALTSTLFAYLYFRKNQRLATNAGTAAAAVGSYLLRTAGITLLLAWIADAAFRKQLRKAMVRAVISLIPVILWQTYIHTVESSQAYKHPSYSYQRAPWVFYNVSYATNVALKHPFRPELGWATKEDLCVRFVRNLAAMPAALGEAVSAREGFWEGHLKRLNGLTRYVHLPAFLPDVILISLGFIVVGGALLMIRKREWLVPVYVSLSIAAICTTPWPGQFDRYVVPLAPFLLILFITCLNQFRRFAQRRFAANRWASAVPVAIALLAVTESAISCLVGYRNFLDPTVYQDNGGTARAYKLFHYAAAGSGTENGLKWLVTHADRRAIVAASMPQWVYLKTGLKTVMPPLEADPQKAQQAVDSVPVTYAVIDTLLMEDKFNLRFPRALRANTDKWIPVYQSAGHEFDIYQRVGLITPKTEHVQLPKGRSLRF